MAPEFTQAEARDRAAACAAELVEHGMVVGIGSGDTATRALRALAARVRTGLSVVAVATSRAAEEAARAHGLTLKQPDEVAEIDLTLDGADEVDGALRLIKGKGGALTREKVVARASRRLVIVIDAQKRVGKLGERARVPVEIMPFGSRWTLGHLRARGFDPALRLEAGQPYVTDGGGYIADCGLPSDLAPEEVAALLDGTTGVVEHGLFLTEASEVYVGEPGQVVRLGR